MNPELVEQTYRRNPILRYTQHPLHSPLLPLPYGDVGVNCKSPWVGYWGRHAVSEREERPIGMRLL